MGRFLYDRDDFVLRFFKDDAFSYLEVKGALTTMVGFEKLSTYDQQRNNEHFQSELVFFENLKYHIKMKSLYGDPVKRHPIQCANLLTKKSLTH